jgi:CIC family chloride channel protein
MSLKWEPIPNSMPLGKLLPFVESSNDSFFPVVDYKGDLEGTISFQDLRNLITKRSLDDLVIVKDVVSSNPLTLFPDETLLNALQKFGLQDVEALPVVERGSPRKLVGILKRGDVITYYNRKLIEKMSRG